jgi:hypothetical protein
MKMGLCVVCLSWTSLVHAAIITYSANQFDADADVSTQGTLITAINLGSLTPVTVNGVTFAGEPTLATNSFFVSSGQYAAAGIYTGGAIGSLTLTQTNDLLDNLEFGPGANNSLARLSGLTVGQQYLLQMIVVDSTNGGTSASYGYSTPSGNATEVYPLTGVSIKPVPFVITGTFTATEAVQDVHVAFSLNANGQVNAFQLRAVPEPAGLLSLLAGSLTAVALFRRRRRS